MKEEVTFPEGLNGKFYISKNNPISQSSHHHSALEFNLVLKGYSEYILQNKRYQLPPHTIVWLFPKQEHLMNIRSSDSEILIAVFKRKSLLTFCKQGAPRILSAQKPKGHHCRLLTATQAQHLIRLTNELKNQAHSPFLYNQGANYILLTAWEYFQIAAPIQLKWKGLHPAVVKTIKLIQENPTEGSLEQLAQACNISSALLSRLFSKQLGMPLSTFRNRIRFERFMLLAEQSENIDFLHLALEAGFGSYAQFHRIFTQTMKCNPATWKRKRKLSTIRP